MSLSSWTSLFFGFSFNEAHHTSEFEFIQRRSFLLFSQSSLHGITLEFGSLSYTKLCLHFSMNKRQLIMCLHPSMNKRQLLCFCSLKNYLVLVFWRFIPQYQSWLQVCFSAEAYMANREWGSPMPISACTKKRVGERDTSLSIILLTTIVCRASEWYLLSPQPRECTRVSDFLVTEGKLWIQTC